MDRGCRGPANLQFNSCNTKLREITSKVKFTNFIKCSYNVVDNYPNQQLVQKPERLQEIQWCDWLNQGCPDPGLECPLGNLTGQWMTFLMSWRLDVLPPSIHPSQHRVRPRLCWAHTAHDTLRLEFWEKWNWKVNRPNHDSVKLAFLHVRKTRQNVFFLNYPFRILWRRWW